ncbi:MAG: hypothetical protein ACRD12_12800 [Acidimicrobiales bacterium]
MQRTYGWAVASALAIGLAACSGVDGGGGGAPGGRAIGDDGIGAAEVVVKTDAAHQPVDAAPSPAGTTIYFLVTGDSDAMVSRVRAEGGPATELARGAPLARPTNVAVATDDSRVFVADPASGGSGAVLVVPSGEAGRAVALPGTQGREPRGLDVVKGADGDILYFVGTDPTSRVPGLFSVPSAGGKVTTIATGSPFVSPDSVVVAADGTAYVSDQGTAEGQGLVFRVAGGALTQVLTSLHLGRPAGVTLLNDDQTLLVSSVNKKSRSNQVLFLDLPTGKTAAATKVIGAQKNSAGGLHKAFAAAVLGWADIQRPGRIYRVDP